MLWPASHPHANNLATPSISVVIYARFISRYYKRIRYFFVTEARVRSISFLLQPPLPPYRPKRTGLSRALRFCRRKRHDVSALSVFYGTLFCRREVVRSKCVWNVGFYIFDKKKMSLKNNKTFISSVELNNKTYVNVQRSTDSLDMYYAYIM